jgi:hypothetical protein
MDTTQNITSVAGLRSAILELEFKQAEEVGILKDQFHLAYESMKPINLIKSTLQEAVGSKGEKNNLFGSSLGLAAGFLSKLLFQGLAKNPVKKILGAVLLAGITNVVAKNPEVVRSLGQKFLNIFRSKAARAAKEAEKNLTD